MPLTVESPPIETVSPRTEWSRVVLPQPTCPVTTRSLPGLTSKEMFLRIFSLFQPKDAWSKEMIGSVVRPRSVSLSLGVFNFRGEISSFLIIDENL